MSKDTDVRLYGIEMESKQHEANNSPFMESDCPLGLQVGTKIPSSGDHINDKRHVLDIGHVIRFGPSVPSSLLLCQPRT